MSPALALLATEARTEALLDWLGTHAPSLAGMPLLSCADLANRLRNDGRTRALAIGELNALADGGDIQLAGRILTGGIAAVICFVDPTAPFAPAPDLGLLLRACTLRDVPLALNEATAGLALRGLAHSRLAFVVFNPVAGQGDPNADLALIRSLLEPQLLLSVVMTRPDQDPAEQTRALVAIIQARPATDPGDALIVACGGDGTISAVAGAVIDTGIPLGVLPRGTANAFAAALGIPADLPGACDTILAGHTRRLDAADCNDRPMILLAGLGFEAEMVDRASRDLKTMLGPLAYVLAGAQQMVAQEPFLARLEVDGRPIDLQAVAITVANVAPASSVLAQGFGRVIPDDGLLEITIAMPESRLQGFNTLASLLASAVVRSPANRDDLLCLRASRITISTDPVQKLVIDGEILEAGAVSFRALPEALTVLAPLPPAEARR